jgi:glucokinase
VSEVPAALAADIGGSHAACALVRNRQVLDCEVIDIADAKRFGPVLEKIGTVLRRFRPQARSCQGVAFSFPGIVNSIDARVLSTPKDKFEDARDLDLRGWCEAELGLPLAIENDARVALLGERYCGAAVGSDDVVMVTLGTGVGGAAIIGGRLLRGRHFQAALGGHFPVRFDGGRCICGAIGCVETEASGWALPQICANWPGFEQSALARSPSPNFEALFTAARSGDRVAAEIRDHCLRVWSVGLVGLIHAYDPELIVIGGAIMGSADQILPVLREHVAGNAWTPWGKVRVEPAKLGTHAGLLGAIPLLAGTC